MAHRPRTHNTGEFHLEVPLDASGIKDLKPDSRVRVVAYDRSGATASSTTVTLDESGHGQARLSFEERPGGVLWSLGPKAHPKMT